MKENFKRLTAILLALVMVLAMSTSAFAATGEKAAGQNVYDAVKSVYGYYEPKWTPGKDVFDGSQTQYLDTFIGYGPVNVDHYYAVDNSGWSKDWGWLYTVNDVMPSFPDNPDHGMAMNQYIIKSGDSIDLVYTLTETVWDSNYKTTFNIVYPWK